MIRSRTRRLLRHATALLDQAVVSASSLLVLVIVGHVLPTAEIGEFAIGQATVLLALSLARALTGEAFVAGTYRQIRDPLELLTGAAVPVAAIGAASCVVLAVVLPSTASAFLGGAVAIPGVLLQDAVRYALISQRRSTALLLQDTTTLLLHITVVTAVGLALRSSLWSTASLGVAPLATSVFVLAAGHRWPRPTIAVSWIREAWPRSSAYAFESVLGAAVGYLTVLAIAYFADPLDVAGFRSTITVFGLTSLVINYVRSTYMRELADVKEWSFLRIAAVYVQIGLLNGLAIALMLALLFFAPTHVGTAVLGTLWQLVAPLAWYGAVNRLCATLSVMPTVLLRVFGVTWAAARARLVVAVLSLGLGPVGAVVDGAPGALLAESLTYLLISTFLTIILARTYRANRMTGASS